MFRTIVCAAIAAAFVALSGPVPAQARMAGPALAASSSATMPAGFQQVQYWYHRRHDRWRWRHHRRWRWRHRHRRHCWHERVRVRHHHHWVWRTIRRCRWR